MPMFHFQTSDKDETTLVDSLPKMPEGLQSEQFDSDRHAYLDDMIPKPWGHEFRVYADDLYDVWKLCLRPGHGTSLHCHPRKQTALLCLGGRGRLELLDSAREIVAGDFAVIGRGVFHRTENISDADLHLVEVEVPRNKFDLVRLADRYGRSGEQYESEKTHAAAELRNGVVIKRSKFRGEVALDGFGFGVSAGLEIVTNPRPNLLFGVSLSVVDAITQHIRVLNAEMLPTTVGHEELYLSISKIEPKEQ